MDPTYEGCVINIGTPLFKQGDKVMTPDKGIGIVHEDIAAVWVMPLWSNCLYPYKRSELTKPPQ